MNIKWSDLVSNVEILKRADLESVEAILASTQLRWAGHISRMGDERIPKKIFYGELLEGNRRVGGQKLRYKDVLKRHLKAMEIGVSSWEQQASDRSSWRLSLHNGRKAIQRTLKAASEQRHHRRHNPGTHQCTVCGRQFHTERGVLQHQRMMHRAHT